MGNTAPSPPSLSTFTIVTNISSTLTSFRPSFSPPVSSSSFSFSFSFPFPFSSPSFPSPALPAPSSPPCCPPALGPPPPSPSLPERDNASARASSSSSEVGSSGTWLMSHSIARSKLLPTCRNASSARSLGNPISTISSTSASSTGMGTAPCGIRPPNTAAAKAAAEAAAPPCPPAPLAPPAPTPAAAASPAPAPAPAPVPAPAVAAAAEPPAAAGAESLRP
ncbi:unnamed protein product [Closterium sp. NIES-54]